MTRDVFDDLAARLKSGDNSVLAVLQQYQRDCIGMLIKKSNSVCSYDEAYDIFLDSVLDFRKNIIRGKVSYGNMKAYLKRICWNKWMGVSRKKSRQHSKEESIKRQFYSDEPHPEALWEAQAFKAKQLAIIEEAMESLSEKCRKILWMSIAEGHTMTEIAEYLEFANANVAKTTKSRCYKRLLLEVRKLGWA